MIAVITRDPRFVDRRLQRDFDTTREQLIEIVKAAVAARGQSTDDSPRSAAAYYAWAAATTRLRQVFRQKGWDKGDENGIETVVCHERKTQIAVLSTDRWTADERRPPRNRTIKGPASEKIIDLNEQFEFFSPEEMGQIASSPYALWYLCIYDNGSKVRAEISKPIEFLGGYITKYSERIFLLQEGDWEKVTIAPFGDDTAASDDLEINVRRK